MSFIHVSLMYVLINIFNTTSPLSKIIIENGF